MGDESTMRFSVLDIPPLPGILATVMPAPVPGDGLCTTRRGRSKKRSRMGSTTRTGRSAEDELDEQDSSDTDLDDVLIGSFRGVNTPDSLSVSYSRVPSSFWQTRQINIPSQSMAAVFKVEGSWTEVVYPSKSPASDAETAWLKDCLGKALVASGPNPTGDLDSDSVQAIPTLIAIIEEGGRQLTCRGTKDTITAQALTQYGDMVQACSRELCAKIMSFLRVHKEQKARQREKMRQISDENDKLQFLLEKHEKEFKAITEQLVNSCQSKEDIISLIRAGKGTGGSLRDGSEHEKLVASLRNRIKGLEFENSKLRRALTMARTGNSGSMGATSSAVLYRVESTSKPSTASTQPHPQQDSSTTDRSEDPQRSGSGLRGTQKSQKALLDIIDAAALSVAPFDDTKRSPSRTRKPPTKVNKTRSLSRSRGKTRSRTGQKHSNGKAPTAQDPLSMVPPMKPLARNKSHDFSMDASLISTRNDVDMTSFVDDELGAVTARRRETTTMVSVATSTDNCMFSGALSFAKATSSGHTSPSAAALEGPGATVGERSIHEEGFASISSSKPRTTLDETLSIQRTAPIRQGEAVFDIPKVSKLLDFAAPLEKKLLATLERSIGKLDREEVLIAPSTDTLPADFEGGGDTRQVQVTTSVVVTRNPLMKTTKDVADAKALIARRRAGSGDMIRGEALLETAEKGTPLDVSVFLQESTGKVLEMRVKALAIKNVTTRIASASEIAVSLPLLAETKIYPVISPIVKRISAAKAQQPQKSPPSSEQQQGVGSTLSIKVAGEGPSPYKSKGDGRQALSYNEVVLMTTDILVDAVTQLRLAEDMGTRAVQKIVPFSKFVVKSFFKRCQHDVDETLHCVAIYLSSLFTYSNTFQLGSSSGRGSSAKTGSATPGGGNGGQQQGGALGSSAVTPGTTISITSSTAASGGVGGFAGGQNQGATTGKKGKGKRKETLTLAELVAGKNTDIFLLVVRYMVCDSFDPCDTAFFCYIIGVCLDVVTVQIYDSDRPPQHPFVPVDVAELIVSRVTDSFNDGITDTENVASKICEELHKHKILDVMPCVDLGVVIFLLMEQHKHIRETRVATLCARCSGAVPSTGGGASAYTGASASQVQSGSTQQQQQQAQQRANEGTTMKILLDAAHASEDPAIWSVLEEAWSNAMCNNRVSLVDGKMMVDTRDLAVELTDTLCLGSHLDCGNISEAYMRVSFLLTACPRDVAVPWGVGRDFDARMLVDVANQVADVAVCVAGHATALVSENRFPKTRARLCVTLASSLSSASSSIKRRVEEVQKLGGKATIHTVSIVQDSYSIAVACVHLLSLIATNPSLGLFGVARILEALYDTEIAFKGEDAKDIAKKKQSLSKYYETSRELAIRLRRPFKEHLPTGGVRDE